MKRNSRWRLRLALVPICALLVLAQSACTDNSATGAAGRLPIPTPVSGVIRQDCETIARSEYFLSDDEENWFTQNCNRLDCATIRGTEYRSAEERAWYLKTAAERT